MVLTRAVQFLLLALGCSAIIWACFDFRFRDAEGFLQGEVCLPVAVGLALLILGWALARRLQRFAFWVALALVGQAVALQMIEAGQSVRYQHYKPLGRLLTVTPPLLLTYLALQTILVAWGLRTYWPKIRVWMSRNFKVWQLLSVGVLFALSSATVSREATVYVAELCFAAFVQLVNLRNIVLAACALPDATLATLKQKLDRLLGQPGSEDSATSGGVDRFAVLAAVWTMTIASLLSIFVYERHPHVQDEVIYLYHARYFAHGLLTVPAPPVPDAFSLYMIPYAASRWYSIFPPGWPAVLAVGVLLGVPWLVNPVLAGMNVLLAYVFIQEVYDRRTARVALLLLCTSPWHIFMAMNFMAHTLTLTCALAAAVGAVRARRTGKARWALLTGGAVGMVILIRPQDGVIIVGLLVLWAIGIGGRRLKASSVAALVLGAIVVGGVALPYNRQLTGDPTVSPLMAYYDDYYGPKTNALGFGPERGLGWAIDAFPGHSPFEALVNADLNAFSINIELFGWSTGSLMLVALLLVSRTMRRSDSCMLVVLIAVFGVYSLYWFSGGPDFGARYWYLMLVPLVALTVRGLQFLETTLQPEPASSSVDSARIVTAVLTMSMLTLVNYLPWRAIDKYHHYLGMRPDVRHLAAEQAFGESVVLIRGSRFPDYASAWIYNPLDPHADVPVYAWDPNPEVRARVLQAYSERSVWIVDGPSLTRSGYKVVGGPLPARELLANDISIQQTAPVLQLATIAGPVSRPVSAQSEVR